MYTNRRRRVGPILQTTRDGQSDRRARRSKMTDAAMLVSDGRAGVPLDVAVDPAQLLRHPGVHPGGGGLKISEK